MKIVMMTSINRLVDGRFSIAAFVRSRIIIFIALTVFHIKFEI